MASSILSCCGGQGQAVAGGSPTLSAARRSTSVSQAMEEDDSALVLALVLVLVEGRQRQEVQGATLGAR